MAGYRIIMVLQALDDPDAQLTIETTADDFEKAFEKAIEFAKENECAVLSIEEVEEEKVN